MCSSRIAGGLSVPTHSAVAGCFAEQKQVGQEGLSYWVINKIKDRISTLQFNRIIKYSFNCKYVMDPEVFSVAS